MKRLVWMLFVCIATSLILPSAFAEQVDEYNYFAHRLQNVDTQLRLSSAQQAKLKPILEQETGEMEVVYGNPATSRSQKLKKYWAIVNKSNESIKLLLTDDQKPAFENMQRDLKQKYDELMQKAKKGN